MQINFVDIDDPDFDPELYLRLLVAVAKSDPDNGPPEYAYVQEQAHRLGLDLVPYWNETSKRFLLDTGVRASRLTALIVIKDCIMLATLDGHFSLGEKETVYKTAERLDLPRSSVDRLMEWLERYRKLTADWQRLVDDR
jgi:tellurite resistance protein